MAEADISTFKTCVKCGAAKKVGSFNKDKNRKDGLCPYCRECSRAHLKEQYHKHKEKRTRDGAENYAKNKEAYKARAKKWAAENPEKRKAVAKKYTRANADKRFLTQRNQRLNNPGYYAAHFKMRQTRKQRAMPKWANIEVMKAIYRQSAFATRISGVKYHVDHFYPLKSELVCGLHNEYNLRITPAAVNLAKGNSFPG